jgi:DNA-binding NarL/FixJ family response regulator
MKVLLVDDSRLLSEGLENLLVAHGLEVLGKANNGDEAIHLTEKYHPDLILMDISMPGRDGLNATRLIKARWPEIKIIILTISNDDQDLFEAIKAGADGYLLKNMNGEELVAALQNLENGVSPLAPGLTPRLLSEFSKLSVEKGLAQPPDTAQSGFQPTISVLTKRQVQVLRLVAQGMTYKEIGKTLSISERTVRYHMSEMLHRLHLQNRNQILTYAARLGLDLTP